MATYTVADIQMLAFYGIDFNCGYLRLAPNYAERREHPPPSALPNTRISAI
jgi:hypothetical protein